MAGISRPDRNPPTAAGGGGGGGTVDSVVAGSGIDVDATDPANPVVSVGTGEVTLAMMANLAQDQFIVRTTASTGVPETATCTAAARTVLDDTTVAAMVDTLGGASSSGSGGLVRITSASLTTPDINDATADSLQAGTASGGVLLKNNAGTTVASFGVGGASSTAIALSGAVALGANSITMTGSIASTGSRVTKLWATDIESTNAPTVGGTAVVVSGGALGTPSSGTLTNCTGLPEAGLLDDAVTLAKMAAGTAGNLITYDASGNPAAVATGTSGHVLTSNGAGAAPTFQAAAGGGANTALSNLASVAINTSLLPGTDNTHDLGNGSFRWGNVLVGNRAIFAGAASGGYISSSNASDLDFGIYNSGNARAQATISQGLGFMVNGGADAGSYLTVVPGGKVTLDGVFGTSIGDSHSTKTAETNGEMLRTYDGIEVENVADRIQTTDNTATTIWDETLADNSVHVIEALVVGRRTDSAGRWSGMRRVTVYRAGGGATLDGSVETIGTDIATNITPTVTFDASSNDVRCRVTGEVGKTVQWRAFIRKVHSA